MLTHKQLRTKALANAEVAREYEKLADEFSLLDEFLKARAAQGLIERAHAIQPLDPLHIAVDQRMFEKREQRQRCVPSS